MKFIKLADRIFNVENILCVEKMTYLRRPPNAEVRRCFGITHYVPLHSMVELPGIKIMLKTQATEFSVTYDNEKERDAAFNEIEKALIS